MRPSNFARWGWLAITFAMAVALLLSAWSGQRRIRQAASTLNRGQGEVLLEAVRQYLREADPNGPFRLDSVLAAGSAEGMRYIGLFEGGDRPVASAGTALGDPQPPHARPGQPFPETVRVDARIRIFGYAPIRPSHEQDVGEGRRRTPPPVLSLEFEPLAARRLESQADGAFVLSAAVAAVLVAAAWLLWRLSLRSERAERKLEEQRRLGMLGTMSAVLAHEIRNPLASLKGHAQLLAERIAAGTSERRNADRIVREARRLEALTSDLLDFARSGPIDIRPSDPAALLRESVDEVGLESFDVSTRGAPSSWPLDPTRMQQALTNVLRNAEQASQGRPTEAGVRTEDGALVFVIRDHGPGIPPGEEERIFSPFYTTRTTGTGLGLPVARRIAELHGGTITARSHPEGGAVFRIVIPDGGGGERERGG